MEHKTILEPAVAHYLEQVRYGEPRDLGTIEEVKSLRVLVNAIGTIQLHESSKKFIPRLGSHLQELLSIVSKICQTPQLEAYIWGSIYILAKVISSEVLRFEDVSTHDVLQLLYDCVVLVPQDLNARTDGLSNPESCKLLLEIYCSFLTLCGEALWFFRDHQHDSHIKYFWENIRDKAIKTKKDIETLVKNFPFPKTHQTHQMISEIISQMHLEQRRPAAEPVDCVPPSLNRYFSGRSDDFKRLEGYLSKSRTEKTFASIALHGFPGAGKTQLALQLAHRCSTKNGGGFFPVLWICAAGRDKIEADVCQVATQLGILPEGISPAEKNMRARKELLSWLQTADNQWMVIFDNASTFADVKNYWPAERPNCAVVVTSRDHAFGGPSISWRHRVNPLNVEQTADLILSILSDVPRTPENIQAAQKIGQELGGLPLAVTQIACYIQSYNVGLKDFLTMYRKRWKKIHQTSVELPDYQDYQDTLTNIWLLYKQKIDSKANLLGEIMAFLQPDKIPMSFFADQQDSFTAERETRPQLEPLMDEFDFLEAKRSLEKGALLQSDRNTGDIQVHRLIQTVVLDSMAKETIQTRFEDTVFLVKAAFPKLTSATLPNAYKSEMWHLAQECLPHVLALQERFRKFNVRLDQPSGFPRLLSDTAWYLCETGQFQRSKNLLQTAEAVCDHDQALRASTRSIRALIYHHQNLQREAMQIWEENLELRRKLHGEGHFLVSNNLCNLAAAYGELGNMEKCRDFFTRGQAHREQHNPGDLNDLALHDCNFTCYLIHYGYLEEAEMTIERSLSRYKQCENDDGFGFNQALFFQAKLRTAQNRHKDALDLHTRALTARRKIMRNHYYTCVSFYHTAHAADLCGDYHTAVDLLEISLKAFESIPEARNYVARSFFRLSLMYEKGNRQQQAKESLRKAQDILRDIGATGQGTRIEDYEFSMPIRFR